MENDSSKTEEFKNYFRTEYVSKDAGPRFLFIRNGNIYLSLVLIIITAIPIIIYQYIEFLNITHAYLTVVYFLICNMLEYLIHRYPMHNKMRGLGFMLEHVSIHHKFYDKNIDGYEEPNDYMAVFLPILYLSSISLLIVGVSILIYFVGDLNHSLFFCFFAYSYYYLYEILHFTYHAKDDSFILKFKLISKLASFHKTHHHPALMNKYNFNISFPIFDFVFRTMYKKNKKLNTSNENNKKQLNELN